VEKLSYCTAKFIPGKDGFNSIILKAIVDKNMWIWHANFGVPGANNDNALQQSPLVANFLKDESQDMSLKLTVIGTHNTIF